MTSKQAQLLNFIRTYMAAHGHSPSYDDMAAALGVASKGNISRYIDRLIGQGMIERRKNVARSVRLVEPCADDLATIDDATLLAECHRRNLLPPMSPSAAEGRMGEGI
jgi:SOS-response transcriptional repressor LexA